MLVCVCMRERQRGDLECEFVLRCLFYLIVLSYYVSVMSVNVSVYMRLWSYLCGWFCLYSCPCINNLCLNAYALEMCLCVRVCTLLIRQTAPKAPDERPSIRLSVSQERTPSLGENMMLWS